MGSSVAVLLACLVLISHGSVGVAALRPAWLAKVKVGLI
jgi:hypothetical protein